MGCESALDRVFDIKILGDVRTKKMGKNQEKIFTGFSDIPYRN